MKIKKRDISGVASDLGLPNEDLPKMNLGEKSSSKAGQHIATGVRRSSGSYELVVSAVLLGLIGFGLDWLFDTTPILTVVLAILGFFGASISIYYRYKEAMSHQSQKRAEIS